MKLRRLTATFVRFSTKVGFVGPKAVFRDVRDEAGKAVADNVSFKTDKQIKELNLQPGDRVSFDVRMALRIKGRLRSVSPANMRRLP